MNMESAVREKLVAAATDLLWRGGVRALSVRSLARHADAPLGSTYHYFPGGRQQLLAEALAFSDRHVCGQIHAALADGVAGSWERMVETWRRLMQAENFSVGCPVIAVIAGNEGEEHVIAAGRIIEGWVGIWSDALTQAGVAAEEAAALSALAISSLQGAILQCRARADTTALDQMEKLVGGLFGRVLRGL
ncbi:MAG: TetR family transcriptional regulator [Neisseria sp.]|nr:TetR family transcriptional regulator [Neisseria sp.]